MAMPEYGNPQVRQAGISNVRMGAETSLEDFGGGQSEANLGSAIQGMAQTAGDIALKEKDKADQVAFMSADRQASELQTQIQVNTSKMLGKDSLGAPDYANKQWNDGLQKIQSGLSNDAQRMAFSRAVNSRWEELNKGVQVHVSNQMQSFDDNETSSYLESSRSAAVLNSHDDQQINLELSRQAGALSDWRVRKGIPEDSPIFQAKLQDQLSGTNKAIIAARLDKDSPNNVQDAKAYLESHKDQMTGSDLVTAQKAVDQAETTSLGLQAWNQMSGWKNADGTPDRSRMQAAIYARTDLSDERKTQIDQFLQARAKEATLEKYQQDASRERSFADDVIKTRQQGGSMTDALKLVNQYGTDAYDQAQKTAFIQKTYAPPEESDPHTYVNLFQGIQNGNVSKDSIEQAFQKNQINTKDYRGLSEEFYRTNTEGNNPQMKQMWQRVGALADHEFGNNKQDKESFLYVLHSDSQGKSPDDIWKSANDKIQATPGTGFMGWFGTPQYKTDVNRLDAQSVAWGKLNQDVGPDETKAIGAGVLYAGSEKWGVQDVDAFAAQFGGYNQIKKGTPVNNAIQSLQKAGQIVTPANVKTLLSKYPDGKYGGGFK